MTGDLVRPRIDHAWTSQLNENAFFVSSFVMEPDEVGIFIGHMVGDHPLSHCVWVLMRGMVVIVNPRAIEVI